MIDFTEIFDTSYDFRNYDRVKVTNSTLKDLKDIKKIVKNICRREYIKPKTEVNEDVAIRFLIAFYNKNKNN